MRVNRSMSFGSADISDLCRRVEASGCSLGSGFQAVNDTITPVKSGENTILTELLKMGYGVNRVERQYVSEAMPFGLSLPSLPPIILHEFQVCFPEGYLAFSLNESV